MASKKRTRPKVRQHIAKVVDGVEGPSLYIDDYRVAGPKPWGGGQILYEFKFDDADLVGAAVFEKGEPR